MRLLSHNQQELILNIFEMQHTQHEGMTTREIKEKKIYKNNTSLYISLIYLENSGLLKVERTKKKNNVYYLLLKGEILARVLATLPDVPEVLQEKAYVF